MATINHVFVLMLENQSFDRLLGQSAIEGIDATSKQRRKVDGSNAQMCNVYNGNNYWVTAGAPWTLSSDPNHEFEDVFEQLTGNEITSINPIEPYPTPANNGFVKNFARLKPSNLADIMSGFTADQLPVINTLAREFAVCDRWFSSMPGPTWPNRFFVHGGSSGGLDHSPSLAETGEWETGIPGGFAFENGTIYDEMKKVGIPFRFYRGNRFLTDDYPIVAALKGIVPSQSHDIKDFEPDLKKNYEAYFTFIEPSYGNIIKSTYAGGTSQHPMDDIRGGEQLIKDVYEAIRKSPLWETSLLIITWDEHGGFYDHVIPPVAVSPGDKVVTPQKTWLQKILSVIPFLSEKKSSVNKFGFTFNRYGVRVPAVVISPWIPKNIIDGTLYDHTSIPATLCELKKVKPLAHRMSSANNLAHLFSLSEPRQDTPETLPLVGQPVASQLQTQADAALDRGNAPGFAYLALRSQLLNEASQSGRQKIKSRYGKLKTHSDLEAHYKAAKRKA